MAAHKITVIQGPSEAVLLKSQEDLYTDLHTHEVPAQPPSG